MATRRRREAVVCGAAGALIALAVLAIIRVLDQDPLERREPAAVGVVPPEPAQPGRGFVLGLRAEVDGCDEPVKVTVSAAGTAEYWLDHRDELGDEATIRLLLPGADPDEVQVRTGTKASDVVLPQFSADPGGGASAARVVRRRSDVPDDARYASAIVTVEVTDWGESVAPVIASYETTAWFDERGRGSCYLRLPALTGDSSVIASKQADGTAQALNQALTQDDEFLVTSPAKGLEAIFDPGVAAQTGFTTVSVPGGDISPDDSLPAPDEAVNGDATWTCRSRPRTAGAARGARPGDTPPDLLLPGSGDTAGALSERAVRAIVERDCSAAAVIVESGASTWRDLVLIIAGAFIGVCAALPADLLLKRLRVD